MWGKIYFFKENFNLPTHFVMFIQNLLCYCGDNIELETGGLKIFLHLCLTNCYNNKNWHNMFVLQFLLKTIFGIWRICETKTWRKSKNNIHNWTDGFWLFYYVYVCVFVCVCVCVFVCVRVCVHVYMRACVHLLVYAYVWNLRERDKCVVSGLVSAHTWQWKHMLDVHKVWCYNFFSNDIIKN